MQRWSGTCPTVKRESWGHISLNSIEKRYVLNFIIILFIFSGGISAADSRGFYRGSHESLLSMGDMMKFTKSVRTSMKNEPLCHGFIE